MPSHSRQLKEKLSSINKPAFWNTHEHPKGVGGVVGWSCQHSEHLQHAFRFHTRYIHSRFPCALCCETCSFTYFFLHFQRPSDILTCSLIMYDCIVLVSTTPSPLYWNTSPDPFLLKATIQSYASFPNPPSFLIHLTADLWSLTQAYPASALEPVGETCGCGTHFSKYGRVSGSGDSRTVWFLSLDSHQSSAPKDGVFWVQGLPSRDRLFPWFIPSLLSSQLKPEPCCV